MSPRVCARRPLGRWLARALRVFIPVSRLLALVRPGLREVLRPEPEKRPLDQIGHKQRERRGRVSKLVQLGSPPDENRGCDQRERRVDDQTVQVDEDVRLELLHVEHMFDQAVQGPHRDDQHHELGTSVVPGEVVGCCPEPEDDACDDSQYCSQPDPERGLLFLAHLRVSLERVCFLASASVKDFRNRSEKFSNKRERPEEEVSTKLRS